ncbi:MAG: hypothetical protein L0H70_07770, partial [Xanthomonadales bacterium]|nr:hypothetical protein [Xanthomonadales bacterium]
ALEGLGRYSEAIKAWQQTYRFELAHFGMSNNETTLALSGWASAEYRAGHWHAARDRFAQVLTRYARHGGKPQITQLSAAIKLCFLEGLMAHRVAAAQRCRAAKNMAAATFGNHSPGYGDAIESTGIGLLEVGDVDAAQAALLHARKLYGNARQNLQRVGRVDSFLALIDILHGDNAQARDRLIPAIAGLRTRDFPLPPALAQARLLLACDAAPSPVCPRKLGAQVATSLATQAYASNPRALEIRIALARLALKHGQAAAAESRLRDGIAKAQYELDAHHPQRLEAQLWLALAEARQGQCVAAHIQADDTIHTLRANHLAAHPLLAAARSALRHETRCGDLLPASPMPAD